MARTLVFVCCVTFGVTGMAGCGKEGNQVIDTSSRPKSTITPEEMDKMMEGEAMTAPKAGEVTQ